MNRDGTPGHSPGHVVLADRIGISADGAIGRIVESAGGEPRFARLDPAHSDFDRWDDVSRFVRFYSEACGLIVDTDRTTTRVISASPPRVVRVSGLCTHASFETGTRRAAFRLIQYPADSVVVLGPRGEIEARFAVTEGVADIALRRDRVIVAGGSNLPASDLVFDLKSRVSTPLPITQAGFRKLSEDGRYLAVTAHQDTISFFDITRTQLPERLWRHVLDDSCHFVVSDAISPSGRFLAYHAFCEARQQVDLHVISREGVEVGVVRHTEEFPIQGLHFVDDRYLLEGVYGREPPPFSTRVVLLYDLGAARH